MVGSVDSSNRNHGEQALCVYPGRPERFLVSIKMILTVLCTVYSPTTTTISQYAD